ncbi:enoyl-CoA hydratase/isomerase family protein [Nonomuraea sp. NN258]|uniref:enoyl-CoA hydratase/isomerase family protein n=1 Tax=Nonomuraea antri TaxID=2730852 RepID=UPI001568A719|nr:enoyl-CoA hydratase/isomerase family protein [Nonomuraea antri]NRQ35083.1 enoyl-CoA hydratase/isomerase family protein [Nonomuraea antri]
MRTLLVDERGDRVVVRLHRPDARNAIDAEMVGELHQVCGLLEGDPRPLLLTGGDGVFAAGADIGELLLRGRDEALQGINSTLFERIRRLPMPTVAAVDGYALGGGAELAYACDLRVASTRAVFGNPEPNLGIIAGAGACWRLKELVGEPLAKLVLLAGHRIDAAEAKDCRLVSEVCEPAELEARAHALIDRMAKASAAALRLTKLVLDAPPQAHPAVDHLAQAVLFEDPEKHARMQKFLDKGAS